MKNKRQNRIEELIKERRVETQTELADLLNREGFNATQATVSRDIRQMNLIKRIDEMGRSYYSLPEENSKQVEASKEKYIRVFQDGCVSVVHAQNLLVIKTMSGMAMAVAMALDAMHYEEIVGSIAGDDTIMCALHSTEEAVEVELRLRELAGL